MMSIYLYANETQTGPFSEEQLQQLLLAGTVSGETMGWKEGMAGWEKLSTFVAIPAARALPPPPPAPRDSSLMGIISLSFGLLSLVGWVVLLVVAGFAQREGRATPTFNMIVGLFLMGGMLLNFLALVVGVVGAFKSRANTLAILGAALNAFWIVGIVALVIIGLVMKSHHA